MTDGFVLRNAAQQLDVDVSSQGLRIERRAIRLAAVNDRTVALDAPTRNGCPTCLSLRGDGVTEWVENKPAGVEQSWVLTTPSNPLTLDIEIDGARVKPAGDQALWILGDPLLVYKELASFDANGVPLPSHFEGTRIVVDTTDAVWPVTVDPLLSNPTLVNPPPTVSSFATDTVTLDWNGDGYGDALLLDRDAGQASLYDGGPTGISTAPSHIFGPSPVAGLAAEAVIGDFNGDGLDDIALGAPAFDTSAGQVEIYHNQPGFNAGPDVRITGGISERVGETFAAADFNGDGVDDLAIGVKTASRVRIYHGVAGSGLPIVADLVLTGPANFGGKVGAGHVDTDPFGDLVTGLAGSATGSMYLYQGDSAGLNTTATWSALQSVYNAGAIRVVDLTGDGLAEIVQPDIGAANPLTNVGRIDIHLNSGSGPPDSSVDIQLGGDHTQGIRLGSNIRAAGDVNGDGYVDLVAGVDALYGFHHAYLWLSAPGGPSDGVFVALEPITNQYDFSIGPGGDLDGDGLADLIVGAYQSPDQAYVYYSINDSDDDGYARGIDCNDDNAAIYPGAAELCNGLDDNCDGQVDTGDYYVDVDGDGYGDDSTQASGCAPGAGYAALGGDCNDGNAAIFPGAEEACNAVDDDCNGTPDDNPTVGTTYYIDSDGDGFGGLATTIACTLPGGYAATSTDCDDTSATVFPGANETCNLIDDDCNGTADDGVLGAPTWYADSDGDLAGAASSGTTTACQQPAGHVALDNDCDDTDASVNPGATEICNSIDDDCNGVTDLDAAGSTWYADTDSDGFGDPAATAMGCTAPVGYVTNGLDCRPTDATSYPGAVEVPGDGIDQNCDTQELCYTDLDGDGFRSATTQPSADLLCDAAGEAPASMADGDCNESNALINPGMTEVCGNAIDDDCNGVTDTDATGATTYLDADGDGFGDDGTMSTACPVPAGYVAQGGDCDDASDAVYPGAPELCGGVDEDCDGQIDEGAAGATVWYADTDGDNFGTELVVTTACTAPPGFVAVSGDCNDNDPDAWPGAFEIVADERDQDCDKFELCYEDLDRDGFRSEVVAMSTSALCSDPGHASLSRSRPGDCNDGSDVINPDRAEVCNGFDDNCDGIIDTDAQSGLTTWHADADADSYGDPEVWVKQCDPPVGFVANKDDCDPSDGNVNPGAVEIVGDEIDQNCDGTEICYVDLDRDGYRANIQVTSTLNTDCIEPGEATASLPDGDCEDGLASANPGATEVCGNGIDDDCNGTIDTDAVAVTTYLDADGDGWGDGNISSTVCPTPSNHVTEKGDCNDADATVYPTADEVCDGVDNDCDGIKDDNPVDAQTWYADADGDGFGSGASTVECSAPVGFVTISGDCNDNNATAFPGGTEVVGDEVDQDCDGVETCYRDIDGDGYRTTSVVDSVDATCSGVGLATITSTQPGDCNDASPTIHPDAPELCNAIDDDCNGATDDGISQDFWLDNDGDGFGDPTQLQQGCPPPVGYVANADDCDDTDDAVSPDADETCNGADDDCDGTTDQNAVDAVPFYLDGDGDGVGSSTSVIGCAAPSGFVASTGDCDDVNALVFPGATEAPADGVDGDCNGQELCYIDNDQDGYRLETLVQTTDVDCGAPYAVGTDPIGDCDDADAARNPGMAEACNNVDDDCNGSVDDNTPLSWADTDGDGYGDPNTASQACPSPSGYVGNDGDCDDSSASVSPLATEICNGIDDDCDGVVDSGGSGLVTWYFDNDGDGYGSGLSTASCSAPSGYVSAGGDCDDANASVQPGATEVPGDGVDANCDGLEECYADLDNDGYRTDITVLTSNIACDDTGKASALVPDGDCDDADAAINPGAPETGNNIDDNCNGNVDEAASTTDDDGDGFCDSLEACIDGSIPGDCNDEDPAISPDSCEVDDDLDNDCSGRADDRSRNPDCNDQDGDGFAFEEGDCNDYDDRIHPDANERCNGLDDDCDGFVDHDELDIDHDGVPGCAGDCDDFDPRAHPGRAENCGDGIDNNCDGVADNDADRDGDGYTTCRGDCDDQDASVNPAADELNNDIDDDCDLKIDEGFDKDQDGVDVCAPGEDPTSGCDCDDTDPTVHPGIAEKCNNGIDDNCDGRPDDDDRDLDNDGVGACDGDCNDNDPFVGAHLPEVCDAIDNDCDGFADEGYDKDVDGWRMCAGDCDDYVIETNAAAKELCDALDNNCDGDVDDQWDDIDGDGFTECQGDCDDDDARISPDAVEICGDGHDNDCSGVVDWKDPTCNAEKLPSRWYCSTGGDVTGLWLLGLALLWRRRGSPGAPDGVGSAGEVCR